MPFSFFEIIQTPNRIQARFLLLESLPFFDGHFPGAPILPGVAHLYLVSSLIELHLNHPIQIASLSRVKFTTPCTPGMEIIIGADFKSDDEASWWINAGLKPASKGIIRFTPRNETP